MTQRHLDDLARSPNIHRIEAGTGQNYNGTTDRSNEQNKGVGSGSTTIFDPAGWNGFSPESALLHELMHAYDKDRGIISRFDLDGNGYPDSEDRAVNFANWYRRFMNENLRDDYGDSDACPNKR